MSTQHSPKPAPDHIDEKEIRLQKRQSIIDAGQTPYIHNSNRKDLCKTINTDYENLDIGEKSTVTLSIAGRLIAKRGHGKASFANLQDQSGSIQLYASINVLGETLYSKYLENDVGDIIEVSGTMFRSKRGELTLDVQDFRLLTKALNPLPEKYHGLQNKELRYRQRYVDLIVNPEVKDVFQTRSKIIKALRDWLEKKDFFECETPVLHHIYGGAAARPFETHHNSLGQDLYLRIALELHLKRLIVGGFEKVFEIGRVFRNEGVSYKHNPEYTLLELYQAYADYNDMMSLTETLLNHLVKTFCGSEILTYQDKTISFALPFKRITMADVIKEHSGVDIYSDDLLQKAKELKLDVRDQASRGELIMLIYDKTCEAKLIDPTFVTDYPVETSPLAKRHRDKAGIVERFELIVSGMELANAFSELNDPIEQKQRFEEQLKEKEAGFEDAHEMDDDFIESLKYGMPPTGGLGIGIDRVIMLITNMPSIRDVLLFPHLKDIQQQ